MCLDAGVGPVPAGGHQGVLLMEEQAAHMVWFSNFGKGTNFFCSDKSRRGVGGGRELTHFNVKKIYKWGKKRVGSVKYI